MASISGLRSLNRYSLSSLRSFVAKSKGTMRSPSSAASRTATASSPSPTRRFPSFSRSPVELGCLNGTLFPLHSAVAAARLTSCLSLTSRSCRALSQDGIDGT
ncbi:uncharacterized protein [Elaeis guineensis]|uniref:Uncharacterized protein LOC105054974 isoform X2 n=1 Tax=Elaeis guineensis var. tenera TaxID=51953 RepID=A0A6I9RZ32_ELAGV|nr:uncharacterized protein LOC105054974 isoform X2 [Elaeis guineensis]